MDALSKILTDIHLTHSEYLYLYGQGIWQTDSDTQAALMSYIVLQGECHLYLPQPLKDDEAQHHLLKQGDIALIPSGIQHVCYAHPSATTPPFRQGILLNTQFDGHRQQPVMLGASDQVPDVPLTPLLYAAQPSPSEQQTEQHILLSVRCHMDSDMAAPLLATLPSVIHLHSAMSSDAPEWLKIGLAFLALESQQSRPGRDCLIDHLVNMMFIECMRDYMEQHREQASLLGALLHPELSQALAAIHSHPELPWSVAQLADQCHMSRSKFAELFSQLVGEPPLSYLSQHRLRLAARLLRETALHIHQIAQQVGYNNETAFGQAFKKRYLASPSQYRLAHLQALANNRHAVSSH